MTAIQVSLDRRCHPQPRAPAYIGLAERFRVDLARRRPDTTTAGIGAYQPIPLPMTNVTKCDP